MVLNQILSKIDLDYVRLNVWNCQKINFFKRISNKALIDNKILNWFLFLINFIIMKWTKVRELFFKCLFLGNSIKSILIGCFVEVGGVDKTCSLG